MSDSNADDDIRTESLRKALNELLTEDDRWRLAMPKHPTEDYEEKQRVCINAILDYHFDKGVQVCGMSVYPTEDAFGLLDCVMLTLEVQAVCQGDHSGLPLQVNIGIPYSQAARLGLVLLDLTVARDPEQLGVVCPLTRTLEDLAEAFRAYRDEVGLPAPDGCALEGGIWSQIDPVPSQQDAGE
jgi:hypothetical protein